MTTADSLLMQGIAAARAGDKGVARKLLSEVVHQNPASEMGWLWLSGVLDTPQGRTFCLRKVLDLNPGNQLAQRGLAALSEARRGPVLVARPAPPAPSAPVPRAEPSRAAQARAAAAAPTPEVAPSAPARARRTRPTRPSHRQKRLWQVTIAGLGLVALALVGTLAFAMLSQPTVAGDDLLAAAALAPSATASPTPHGTLRPTFTTTPTPSDTATLVPTLTPLPTSTETPAPTEPPTDTPSPAPTSTRRPVVRSAAVVPTNTPAPRPTLPPCQWDSRLNALGVRVERASAGPGQPFWRLIKARWSNEQESAGKHTIFVEVLDARGARAVGQTVIAQWGSGSVALPVKNPPSPDWPADFAMFNTLGSYAISIGGAPSDRVVGMGLGTAAAPDFTIHTSFYLTFQLVHR
jgi:hypothetical protein